MIFRNIAFGCAAILVVFMAVISVFGKLAGTEAAMEYGYHSPVFIALWAAVAVSGAIWMCRWYSRPLRYGRSIGKTAGKLPFATISIHLSFLLILAGAMATHVSGEQGTLHLRIGGGRTSSFVAEDGVSDLPFGIVLDDFRVEYYPGTSTPMDYVSRISVYGRDIQPGEDISADGSGPAESGEVSMNRVFRYGGYRFYQASYDDDGLGSTLAVSHDPYGTGITFAGYALLLLSVILFFFQKDSGFRSALWRLSGKESFSALAACAVIFFLSSAFPSETSGMEPVCGESSESVSGIQAGTVRGSLAGEVDSAGSLKGVSVKTPSGVTLKTLPESTAASFGDMYIYYNGRIAPVQTLAMDFTMKLYASRSYRGLNAEQVLTGWIFFHDVWRRDFDAMTAGQKDRESVKAVRKQEEKEEVIMMVCSGQLMKIFPYRSDSGDDGGIPVRWYSSSDNLPLGMDDDQWLFVRKVMSLVGEKVTFKDFPEEERILGKIREYQRKEAGEVLPSDSIVSAEKAYNGIDRPKPLFMVCLTVGFLLFILVCALPEGVSSMIDGKIGTAGAVYVGRAYRVVRYVAVAAAAAVFVCLTAILGLRWAVSGHIPMSNGFETMMTLAWITLLFTFLSCRRLPVMLPFGLILSGFALLVASLGESDPQISHLMPVLSSPLLSIHVASMMISYSLLGLVMLNGIMTLVRYAARRRHGDPEDSIAGMTDLSLVILYPAVFFLVTGTFLGAVWANISWGRYWAWDPKEVWALITLLVYAFSLHGRSLRIFRNPVFFHWYCILAFLCVLITYFGVNFFLGGLHSYA